MQTKVYTTTDTVIDRRLNEFIDHSYINSLRVGSRETWDRADTDIRLSDITAISIAGNHVSVRYVSNMGLSNLSEVYIVFKSHTRAEMFKDFVDGAINEDKWKPTLYPLCRAYNELENLITVVWDGLPHDRYIGEL